MGQIGNKKNLPLVLHEPDTELAFQVPYLYNCSYYASSTESEAGLTLRSVCVQALVLDAGKENVVTVFGFPNNEATGNLVVQEFGKCGDILRYHSDKQCNWMHIQYGVS